MGSETQRPGYFLLTLDTELAWGTSDPGGLTKYKALFEQTGPAIRRLLDLLDKYSIPATWAFVGHLLLDRCELRNGTTHPEVLRPSYGWYPGDWHALDPGTDLERDPFWYCADIFEWVRGRTVPHEIGTHTFSHVIMDDPACTREIPASQLAACREMHGSRGLELTSLVFPRNRVAHLDVLREAGIIAYRGPEESWLQHLRGNARRAGHLAHRLLALPPPTYRIEGRAGNGLVNLPASMLLLPYHGVRRFIPVWSRFRQAELGIGTAARQGEIFHLSFHPFNLPSTEKLFDILGRIFRLVTNLREQGKIEPRTMTAMARLVLARDGFGEGGGDRK